MLKKRILGIAAVMTLFGTTSFAVGSNGSTISSAPFWGERCKDTYIDGECVVNTCRQYMFWIIVGTKTTSC